MNIASEAGKVAMVAIVFAVGMIWMSLNTGGAPRLSVLPGVGQTVALAE